MEYEEVTKTRKKTVRLPLTIGGPGLVMPSMTAEQLKVGRSLMCSGILHSNTHRSDSCQALHLTHWRWGIRSTAMKPSDILK